MVEKFLKSIKTKVPIKADPKLEGTRVGAYYNKKKNTIFLNLDIAVLGEDKIIEALCHELIHYSIHQCGLGLQHDIAWDFIDCRTRGEIKYYLGYYIKYLIKYDLGPEIFTYFMRTVRRLRRRIRKLLDRETAEIVLKYFGESLTNFKRKYERR